jgi:hypothetical protein
MYRATHTPEDGWQGAIEPYGPLLLEPSAQVLNYGQSIFEGMKAQRSAQGRIVLFRPDENAARMMAGVWAWPIGHSRACHAFKDTPCVGTASTLVSFGVSTPGFSCSLYSLMGRAYHVSFTDRKLGKDLHSWLLRALLLQHGADSARMGL